MKHRAILFAAVLLLSACGPDKVPHFARGDDPSDLSDEALCFLYAKPEASMAVKAEMSERRLECADLLETDNTPGPSGDPHWRANAEAITRSSQPPR